MSTLSQWAWASFLIAGFLGFVYWGWVLLGMSSDHTVPGMERGARRVQWSTLLLYGWAIMLLPWAPFALLSPMVFDGGRTIPAYMLVWSIWTFPVTLLIAAIFRRKIQSLALLPFLNVVAFLFSDHLVR